LKWLGISSNQRETLEEEVKNHLSYSEDLKSLNNLISGLELEKKTSSDLICEEPDFFNP